MSEIVIFGASGFARETHQIIRDINRQQQTWEFKGFLDDNTALHGSRIHGFPVLGGGDWLTANPGVPVVVAIGNPRAKRTGVERISRICGVPFATLVHPLAWLGDDVELGDGSIVCAGVRVTCDIRIGAHVILNLDCTVGHDSVIEDYSTIAPSANISGAVHLGRGVDIGTNATVIQGITIGSWSIVGAGAAVVRDVPPFVTAVGVPAVKVKDLPPLPSGMS
jgi:sugar O-acyltransferase (sialic acid O-acetyltransferase NeuD family)